MIDLTCSSEGYKFPEKKIQTTIIDPPYNIGFNYRSNFKDLMTLEEYNKFIYDCIEGCYENSTDSSSLFLINYPEIIFALNPAITESSWNIYQFIQWIYPTNQKAQSKFTRASRSVVWLTKDEPKVYIDRVTQAYKNPTDPRVRKHIENGKTGTHLYDWWDINIVKKGSKQHFGYVNQIPYELLKRLILTTTDKGDVVYDPMCGSGSTVFAADHLGRYGIGCDINPDTKDIWESCMEGGNPYTRAGYERYDY